MKANKRQQTLQHTTACGSYNKLQQHLLYKKPIRLKYKLTTRLSGEKSAVM